MVSALARMLQRPSRRLPARRNVAMLSSERCAAATKPLKIEPLSSLAVLVVAQCPQPFVIAGRSLAQPGAEYLLQAGEAFEAEMLGEADERRGLDIGGRGDAGRGAEGDFVGIVQRIGGNLAQTLRQHCALRSRIDRLQPVEVLRNGDSCFPQSAIGTTVSSMRLRSTCQDHIRSNRFMERANRTFIPSFRFSRPLIGQSCRYRNPCRWSVAD